MLTRLLRLLAPLIPRRRPRSFHHLASRPVSDQSLPLETAPPQPLTTSMHPAVPGAVPPPPSPNLHSPTRPKNRPKLSLASPPPLGAGWREIAPPSPPPNPRRPPPTRRPIQSPQPPLAAPRRTTQPPAQPSPHRPGKTSPTPCHTPLHPSPGVAWRVPESAKNRPAAPQEFFGKNSYAREPATSRVPNGPSPAPARAPPQRPPLDRSAPTVPPQREEPR